MAVQRFSGFKTMSNPAFDVAAWAVQLALLHETSGSTHVSQNASTLDGGPADDGVPDSRHGLVEFAAFMADLELAARAIAATCRPDLMNYASLGNVVPHLHWHLVPRYMSDRRWGGPIYTTTREEMRDTRLSELEYMELATAIQAHLEDAA